MALCTHFAQAQSDAEQKAWMAYSTPGDMQKKLAASNGTWKEEISMWMQPGTDPMKSTGMVKNEMIMGGRYQQSTFTGDFMGMPFQGLSITGYDNARKVFVNTWVDNMGTGIMNSEGVMLPDGKSIEFRGKTTDPMTGNMMDFREVFTFVDKDHQKMEMYMTQGVTESKNMEILFTRTK